MPLDLVLAQAVVNLILIQTLYSLLQSAFATLKLVPLSLNISFGRPRLLLNLR